MTTLFEKMGLSIEKYNGLAILLALLALCASIFAIFANGKPNVLKTNTASVSVPEKFRLNQYLGHFYTHVPVSIVNDGGNDLNLKNATLVFENNGVESIRLLAESYQKIGDPIYIGFNDNAGFPLADVIVKPGGSWSGNIYLAEIPSAENREKMDELEIQFGKESRRRSARLQSLAVNALEKISNGSIKDALNTAALGGINLTNCSAPPKELSDLATQLTQQGLSRLSKGSYQVKLEISDVEKVLSKRNRQAILFERHLRILQDEDSLASNICASLASNYTTNFKLPASGIQIEYSRISLASK